jgi:monoterpene epsilon-lactone hydrolase
VADTADQPIELDERLSPNLRGLVRALIRNAPDPAWPIEEHHARYEAAVAARQLPDDVRVIATDCAGCPAELVAPATAAHVVPSVLYLHGGGFIMGSALTARPITAQLARLSGRTVLALDYAHAPQARYPVQLEQVVAAFAELVDNGLGPDDAVLMGDSAGGGLALAATYKLRERARPLPGRLVLLSPWLDLTLSSASIDEFTSSDPQTPRWLLDLMRSSYLGAASAEAASPLYADPHGLPPVLVQVAELEGLRDDGLRFAERARAAGAAVEVDVWPGAVHVWHQFAPRLPEAEEALRRVVDWINS